MTNYEHYKNEIKKITNLGLPFAVNKNSKQIELCGFCTCEYCVINDIDAYNCSKAKFKWAYEEYVEPDADWSKVVIDTKILVKHNRNSEWKPRYFAKYDGNNVYAWSNGTTSFSCNHDKDYTPWSYAKLAEDE